MKSAFLAVLLCAFMALSARAGEEAAAPYRLQPGDVVSISVRKETDLQAEVLVRPDGGLSFPLAGEQAAAGRTVDELRLAIEDRLRKYIPDPVVTVAIRAIGGNKIYVVGKVARPGEIPFVRPLDVMQVLAMAGGTTPFANLDAIMILRREAGRQTSIRFRYEDVADGRKLEQNVILRSGDTVVVP